MKLLYLHRTQAKGVEGVHIGEIVKGMRALGHSVAIVSPVGERFGDAAEDGAGARGWSMRLYKFVTRYVPELIFELLELAYNISAVRQARKRVDGASLDAIFERYAIFGLAGAHLARRWRKPLYLEVNYTSRSPLVRRRSRLLRPLAERLDRRIFSAASALFAVSSTLKDELVRRYGIPAQRVHVLPNAADPDVFDPARVVPADIPGPAGRRFIGFVGGFYPWHGLSLLLEAFVRIAPRFPDAALLLIGDGPMRGAIEARAAESGLAERVLFQGRVPHALLPRYVARFHVGVMPDSNDYGSPMKIFEYMAMAKPVVVPDYPPLRDVVTDGEQGLIFRPGDAQALAGCLERMLRDEADYRRMAQRARAHVLEKHNWRANAEFILRTIEGDKK